MDEATLVRRAARGDAGAFGELFDRYAGDVYRIAQSMVQPRAEAEDVMQETFLAAFEGIGRFERRASFKTWLLAILFRQVGRYRRYHGIRKTEALDEAAWPGSNGRPHGPESGRLENRLDAHTMLDTLSDEHRAVLVLRELEGMTYAEIAQTLNVPRGTVESRLFRARNTLRERFHDFGTRPRNKGATGGKPVESRHE